jgi:transcriptional regulator GlxA family with amidase domain
LVDASSVITAVGIVTVADLSAAIIRIKVGGTFVPATVRARTGNTWVLARVRQKQIGNWVDV